MMYDIFSVGYTCECDIRQVTRQIASPLLDKGHNVCIEELKHFPVKYNLSTYLLI